MAMTVEAVNRKKISDAIFEMERFNRQVKRTVSAKMCGGEYDALRGQVKALQEECRENILQAIGEGNHDKSLDRIDEISQETIELINKKEAAQPIPIKIGKRGNSVTARVNLNQAGYGYHRGRKSDIRINKSKDKDQYPYIVALDYLQSFLDVNGIDYQDIQFSEDSIDTFYTFDGKVGYQLTEDFVSDWIAHDCPYLYRCTVNKEGWTNMLGEQIPIGKRILIERSWHEDYVDDSITEEEYEAIRKFGMKKLNDKMRLTLHAKGVSHKTLQKIEDEVKAFEKEVQNFIDSKKEEVFLHLHKLYPESSIEYDENGEMKLYLRNEFMMDCGFFYLFVEDEAFNEKKRILGMKGRGYGTSLNVSLPYSSQSVVVMDRQGKFLIPLLEKEFGKRFWSRYELD